MAIRTTVTRVIALEEAFLHPSVREQFPADLRERYRPVEAKLTDVGPDRIARMDAAGIDLQVLSHVQPGVQFLEDPALALHLAREVNDWLADVTTRYPDRFAGFATLPTQSPAEAADELERTVTKLGFKGAMINGHTNGRYLSDPAFHVLLGRAESLGVPIYIHPTDPPKAVNDVYYEPFTATLVPTWGWPVETATHLLKMICVGIFDRFPHLNVIVGHMGELLPYCYSRLKIGLTMGSWLLAVQGTTAGRTVMEKSVDYYLRNNVYITSSGVFDQPVFECAVAMLGIDHLMFSVDDPLRDNVEAMDFLEESRLTPADKERFAHGTAEKLLGLSPGAVAGRRGRKRSIGSFGARLRSRLGRAIVAALVK